MNLVEIEQLSFTWPQAQQGLSVPHFHLAKGETLLLRGPSGQGKTTLLSLISGLIRAQSGRLSLAGHNLSQLGAARRDALRADYIGMIHQQFHLLPYLSVANNIELGLRASKARQRRLAQGQTLSRDALLAQLDLDAELLHRPVRQLSVGQQQRVAVVRALLGGPELILADEPTSSLDTANRDRFLSLLLSSAKALGSAVLLVSHDDALATAGFDRVQNLADLLGGG